MKETVLILPIKRACHPNQVLLGLKKTGFGKGKYCGIGGKVEAIESPKTAAVRELYEETRLTVYETSLQEVGFITFTFQAKPEWNLTSRVFMTLEWEGDPIETEEIIPYYFRVPAIPYQLMWQDSGLWLPYIFQGRYVKASFHYDRDNEHLASHDLLTLEGNNNF